MHLSAPIWNTKGDQATGPRRMPAQLLFLGWIDRGLKLVPFGTGQNGTHYPTSRCHLSFSSKHEKLSVLGAKRPSVQPPPAALCGKFLAAASSFCSFDPHVDNLTCPHLAACRQMSAFRWVFRPTGMLGV